VKEDKKKWFNWKWPIFFSIFIGINILSSGLKPRWDFTSSGIYTLSERNREIVEANNDRVVATLLMGDKIPASFKKLKNETEFFLSSLHGINGNIWYDVFDPNQGSVSQVSALRKLFSEKNVNPTNLRITSGDEIKETLIYPYIHLEKGDSELFINILESRNPGESEEDAIYRSIQKLESKVTKGLFELSKEILPQVGVIAFEKFLKKTSFDLSNSLSRKYSSIILSPKELFEQRDSTQLAIIPISPEINVNKEDLIFIDQFLINGGKVLWLIEEYNLELDSINIYGSYIPKFSEIAIQDFLFHTGVRLSGNWLSDLRSSRIPQVIGEQGGRAQTEMFNYPFHPVMQGNPDHFISSGLGEVNMLFPTIIDTVITSFEIKKTPLITSSDYSKKHQYPIPFSFESLRESVNVDAYHEKRQITSILLEGSFQSYFQNRLNRSQVEKMSSQGISLLSKSTQPSAQIIVTDQSVFMPGADRSGRKLPIGFNKWERSVFLDNETFLTNCLEYLINGDLFLQPDERSEQKLASFDKQRIVKERTFWIGFNLILPLILLLISYFGFSIYLKKKYA